ncbi:hypothetical protein H0N95_02185 [Candidatus Micrarchaeota archaeon]|nr:hypothetical protein [Candidatus Micrarchaeota archaeon]
MRKFSPGKIMASMPEKEYYSIEGKAKVFARNHKVPQSVAHTAMLYLVKHPEASAKQAIESAERFWKPRRVLKFRK